MGVATAIGKRRENTLAYSGRTESTVLPDDPETLDAELLQEGGRSQGRGRKESARADHVHGRVATGR